MTRSIYLKSMSRLGPCELLLPRRAADPLELPARPSPQRPEEPGGRRERSGRRRTAPTDAQPGVEEEPVLKGRLGAPQAEVAHEVPHLLRLRLLQLHVQFAVQELKEVSSLQLFFQLVGIRHLLQGGRDHSSPRQLRILTQSPFTKLQKHRRRTLPGHLGTS